MSEARTVWRVMEARQSAVAHRRNGGFLIAVCLLGAMAAAEVLFLRFVAGPDSVNMLSAAEGIAPPP